MRKPFQSPLLFSVFAILSLLVMLFGSSACHSAKKVSGSPVKKDTSAVAISTGESDSANMVQKTLQEIKEQHIDYTTFASKVKVDYADSKKQQYDFNANLRMYKDSVIWISITAVLGIEAFRVMITPDSVIILDKVNKEVQIQPLSYIQSITNLPIDFRTLQDLILGNPVFVDSNIVAFKEEGEYIRMASMGDLFKNLLTLYKGDFSLRHSKLNDVDAIRNRTADLAYDDYQNDNGYKPFSTRRSITIEEKNKMELNLEFKQVVFNEPLNFPFSIPQNYKLK